MAKSLIKTYSMSAHEEELYQEFKTICENSKPKRSMSLEITEFMAKFVQKHKERQDGR